MKVVKTGGVVDGVHSTAKLEQAVLVEDGRILEIVPWAERSFDGIVLDFSDYTILPGFIDTHLHITLDPVNPKQFYGPNQLPVEIAVRGVANAQAALRAGVTTIGDCGAINEIVFPIRDAINRGALLGPRILASGKPIVPAGGHGAELGKIASGVEDVRKAVREQAEAGADFIKVMATAGGGEDPGESHYNVEELTAMREEAERFGLVVAAHAHGSQGIRNCVEAGIQRIEHCSFDGGKAGFSFDPDTAEKIAEKGIIISPTNVIDYRRIEKGGTGAPRGKLNEIWRKLLSFGVTFAASSDAGVTDILYDDYALIPELMVTELGMSPFEAIRACTYNAAKALRLNETLGTLEAGKAADLVAVRGQPLDDIIALRNVVMVMRNGNIVHRAESY